MKQLKTTIVLLLFGSIFYSTQAQDPTLNLAFALNATSGSSSPAHIDPNLYGQQNQRRSIWDKEPEEPKKDQPMPFSGNTQDGIPIDGGLAFLKASGLMYGAQKMYKSTKNSPTVV